MLRLTALTEMYWFYRDWARIKPSITALAKGTETPRLNYPPLTVHRFSEPALSEGIEQHKVDGVSIKVYCAEKTLADCFKFRNKIGMDTVLEALAACISEFT